MLRRKKLGLSDESQVGFKMGVWFLGTLVMFRDLKAALVVASIVGLTGCASMHMKSALEDIDALALQAHMDFLADDLLQGRMTGSAEYRIAAQYVESQFRQIGLEAGFDQSFMQEVPMLAGQLDIDASWLKLHGIQNGQALRFREDFVLSPNLGGEQRHIQAPMVFVGHGVVAPELEHNDYAGLDVRGKIVVMFPKAPKTFCQCAISTGATTMRGKPA